MSEEKGANEVNLELDVISGAMGRGVEPAVDELGLSRLRRVSTQVWCGGGFQKEPVRGGSREGGGEVGLGLEDDLEGGGGEWWDEAARWVDEELVGGGGLELESQWGGRNEGFEANVGAAFASQGEIYADFVVG